MNIVGIGTDIVECQRIDQMLQKHGEIFVRRVYTDHEIEYCTTRKAATQHFAGRWAAKEAVLKVIGTGWARGIAWRDVEVKNEPGGKPFIVLSGGARDVARDLGISQMMISISHCKKFATAYAMGVGKD